MFVFKIISPWKIIYAVNPNTECRESWGHLHGGKVSLGNSITVLEIKSVPPKDIFCIMLAVIGHGLVNDLLGWRSIIEDWCGRGRLYYCANCEHQRRTLDRLPTHELSKRPILMLSV